MLTLIVPFAGVAFVVIFFFLDLETPHTPLLAGLKAIDWLGGITIIGATITLLIGLEFGGVTFPWDSREVICLVVFGSLMIGLFWVFEAKFARYPVMPLRLFKHRSNVATLVVCFTHALTFIAANYYLPLYFQSVLGATPLQSGIYLLPFALTIAVASTTTGILTRRTGRYLEPIRLGMALLAAGFGLFIALGPRASWAQIIAFQIIAGLGAGANIQTPLIALQTLTAARDNATATSTFGFIRGLAFSISVVIGGVVFQNGMEAQHGRLAVLLGADVAGRLSGGNAGANVAVIATLPPALREIARGAFAHALRRMWIMYTCTAAVGFLASWFIGRQELSTVHEEVKTGLQDVAADSQTQLTEKSGSPVNEEVTAARSGGSRAGERSSSSRAE